MNPSLIIAGCGLATVAVATMALRLHREGWALRQLAARRGWQVSRSVRDAWSARLRGAALMRIGHSRRIEAAFRTPDGSWLFAYVYETGFEYRRETHSWRVVVREIGPRNSRATITSQDWLIATAHTPSSHQVALSDAGFDEGWPGGRTAVVEDGEAWIKRLNHDLRAWLGEQPEGRSWEIFAGLLVGYEPGGVREAEMAALAEDAGTLADLLGE